MLNDSINIYSTEKEFQTHFSEILLTPEVASSESLTYKGFGYIIFTEDNICLNAICKNQTDKKTFFPLYSSSAGKFVSKSEYYKMKATDLNDEIWFSEKIMISKYQSKEVLIKATLNQLRSEKEKKSKQEHNELEIFYDGHIKIPYMYATTTKKKTAGVESIASHEYDTVKFKTPDLDIELTEKKQGLKAKIKTKLKISDLLISRINETLQFTLSRILQYSMIRIIEPEKEIVQYYPKFQNQENSRNFPPFQFHNTLDSNHFCNLFSKYFHSTFYYKKKSHPVFECIYLNLESGKAPIEIQALTTSVSIERLLKEAFDIPKESKNSIDKEIKKVKEFVNNSKIYYVEWEAEYKTFLDSGKIPSFKQEDQKKIEAILGISFSEQIIKISLLKKDNWLVEINEQKLLLRKQSYNLNFSSYFEEMFKNRLNSTLSNMSQTRPIDILYKLKDEGIISQKLIESWKSVRNSSAHGGNRPGESFQDYITLCHDVLTLFHLLVFLVVGYSGTYTDYSKIGFPFIDFDSTIKENILVRKFKPAHKNKQFQEH